MNATPHFSSKLDTLAATLDMFRSYAPAGLGDALSSGAGRHALSIGSGGSSIAAEYLARCRDTLALGPTTVQTPMQLVLEQYDLAESDVWFFSAGGDNPDVIAAVQAAIHRRARSLHIVTRNPEGAAAHSIRAGGGSVHLVPVADAKDGYLATHSLLSSVTALLLASDRACGEPRGADELLEIMTRSLMAMLDSHSRSDLARTLQDLSTRHTVVVATDPKLRPVAVLLDTSIWEASLCHVQTTDFRNLAHGRHTWLHHRSTETLILALTTADSRRTWSSIERLLPDLPHRLVLDHSDGGRLDNALAMIDGLGLIEAMGAVVGVDPGKPGIGEFGRPIYEDSSLKALAVELTPAVRHKRATLSKADTGEHGAIPLHQIWRDRIGALAGTTIGGVVFDYDGTLVTTEGRWDPPASPIIEEIVRLHSAGLRLGIATGRGGSAGESLRKVLPANVARDMLIGYYNGGCIRSADVDLRTAPPLPDAAIQATARWLEGRPDLFVEKSFKAGPIQITVDMEALARRYRFMVDIADCPAIAEGKVRVTASGHSYDILPTDVGKLAVVQAVAEGVPPNVEILRFGDSGSRSGNDNALLSHPFGISVGEICDAPNGCWSLFGSHLSGPQALLKILRALVPSATGDIRLDIGSLGLDPAIQIGA